jgi:hypothetical protein
MTEPEHHDPSSLADRHPELLAALGDLDYACVTVATEAGTALVVKLPSDELAALGAPVPTLVVHELYDHPSAPVIRIALRIYDQPLSPLGLETFINVADPSQRADYAALGEQDDIPLLFVDAMLQPRLAKRVSHAARDLVPRILAIADERRAQISPATFDFERAKAAVMASTQV